MFASTTRNGARGESSRLGAHRHFGQTQRGPPLGDRGEILEPETGLEPVTPCLQAHAGSVVECRGVRDLASDGEI
jgi:hypothetical protein